MNISWSSKIKGLATINCDRHTDSRGIYQLIFDNQVWSRSQRILMLLMYSCHTKLRIVKVSMEF